MAVLMLLTTIVGVLGQPISAQEGYTVPITYSEEGYRLVGLEDPLDSDMLVENRNVHIETTGDKETAIYNFRMVITNPKRSKRTVYSSIIDLYPKETYNAQTGRILNSTGLNLVIYPGDKISLLVKKETVPADQNPRPVAQSKTTSQRYTQTLVKRCGSPNTGFKDITETNSYTEYTRSTVTSIDYKFGKSVGFFDKPIEMDGFGLKSDGLKTTTVISLQNTFANQTYTEGKKEVYGCSTSPSDERGAYSNTPNANSLYYTVNIGGTRPNYTIKSIVPATVQYTISMNTQSNVQKRGKLEPTEEDSYGFSGGDQWYIKVTGADNLDPNPNGPDTPDPGTCDTTELDNKIKQLEAQITQLKNDLATKTTDNDKLAKEKADLQEKLDKANKELADIKTKVAGIVDGAGTDTNANLDKLNQQLKDLQTEVEGYKTEIEKLKADNQKLQDKIKELEDKVSDLEKKLKQCQDKCTADTAQCAKDKAALEKEVETIREKIVKVIDGVKADNITDAANALLKKVSDLEAKVKDLEAKLAAKEKELQDEKNKNAQLQNKLLI